VLEGGKISSRQAAFLMTTMIFATVILFVPGITARYARQDAWIPVILAVGAGLMIARLVIALGLRFPDKTIFRISGRNFRQVAGETGRLDICLVVSACKLGDNQGVRRVDDHRLHARHPHHVFHLALVAMAAYAVRNGLEVFTRANEIFLPLMLGSIIILFILSTNNMDFSRLLPVFDAEAADIVKGGVAPLFWFGQILNLTVVIPYLNKPQDAYRVAIIAVLLSGVFFLLTVVGILAIFGPHHPATYMFPVLNGARIISIANILERLEAVIIAIWIAGGFIKISIFYWATALGSAQVLELKDYRPLVLPIGAVLVAMSILLHPNIMDLTVSVGQVWPVYGLSVFLYAKGFSDGFGFPRNQPQPKL
jgi:spore germination protein KB